MKGEISGFAVWKNKEAGFFLSQFVQKGPFFFFFFGFQTLQNKKEDEKKEKEKKVVRQKLLNGAGTFPDSDFSPRGSCSAR